MSKYSATDLQELQMLRIYNELNKEKLQAMSQEEITAEKLKRENSITEKLLKNKDKTELKKIYDGWHQKKEDESIKYYESKKRVFLKKKLKKEKTIRYKSAYFPLVNRKYNSENVEVIHKYLRKFIMDSAIRGKFFEVPYVYLYKVLKEQKFRCAISGVKIVVGENASIDRIDSTKGYIVGNIQWLDKKVNIMKYTMTNKELIEWANKIYEHNLDPQLN
jgi:hypothetical protein